MAVNPGAQKHKRIRLYSFGDDSAQLCHEINIPDYVTLRQRISDTEAASMPPPAPGKGHHRQAMLRLLNGHCPDCLICCQNVAFPLHKHVLCSQSGYFFHALNGTNAIRLVYEPNYMHRVFEYLYLGVWRPILEPSINDGKSESPHAALIMHTACLYTLANHLDMPGLKRETFNIASRLRTPLRIGWPRSAMFPAVLELIWRNVAETPEHFSFKRLLLDVIRADPYIVSSRHIHAEEVHRVLNDTPDCREAVIELLASCLGQKFPANNVWTLASYFPNRFT